MTAIDHQISDRELILRFRSARDEAAFACIVRRYGSMVLMTARQVLGDEHRAEDVHQAVFMVLASDANRIRNPDNLSAWLYGVTYRMSMRVAKQEQKHVSMKESDLPSDEDTLSRLISRIERDTVLRELGRLPEKHRTVIILKYFREMTVGEVSQALRLTENTVAGRLKRGRNELRLRLARQGMGLAVFAAVVKTMESDTAASTLVSRTVDAYFASNTHESNNSDFVHQLSRQESTSMFLRHISKQTVALAAVMSLVAMSVTSWPTDGSAHAQDGDLEVVLKQEKSATTHSAVAKVASSARSSTSTPAKLSHEARITNALKSRTRLQFEDSPLTEVLDVVAQQHGIQIVVDEEGLHSEGMTPDSPVTLRVQDIRLENALTLMLRPKRLAAILTEEVLLVTSQQIADAYSTSTIVYPFDPKIWATEDLVNLVRSKVEPTSWEETGGRGSITGIEGGLVVRQPKRVHEELQNLLQQLADHARFQHALQSGNR